MNHCCCGCPVGHLHLLCVGTAAKLDTPVQRWCCRAARGWGRQELGELFLTPFMGIYSLLQAAVMGTCLHTRTPCITIWSGILVLFWWIITVCTENSHSVGSNPWILMCRTIAEDGNLSCFSKLFLLWNWACDSMKWGAEKREYKWCPEEKQHRLCSHLFGAWHPGNPQLQALGCVRHTGERHKWTQYS